MHIQLDDFDPDKTLKRLAAHIDQPEKFAQLFCEAARTQKSIDQVIKEIFRSQVKNDLEVIASIKTHQRAVDKEDWRNFFKKMGIVGWTIISIAIGAILQALSRKFLG